MSMNMTRPERTGDVPLAQRIAEISARLDRVPSCRAVWRLTVLLSLGAFFEFYDNSFTAYVLPGMIRAGLFEPVSLGPLSALGVISVSGPGTFVFSSLAGLWIGSLFVGHVADRFGRRAVFTWSLVFYVVCTGIMAFQQTGFWIDAWRLLAGVGIGVELVTIDAYLSEINPAPIRGRAFALQQAIANVSFPVAAILSYWLVPIRPFGLDGWRWVVLAGSVGAVAVWFIRRALPESPRWLVRTGKADEADQIVRRIEQEAERELGRPLPAPTVTGNEQATEGLLREIFARPYLSRTIMGSLILTFSAFGFWTFRAWAPLLLAARGVSFEHSLLYTLIISFTYPIGSALTMTFADRLERKTQIVLANIGMAAAMILFAQVEAPVILILCAVVFTLASTVHAAASHNYLAELYPTRIRARGVGFCLSWNRLASAFAGLAIGYILHTGSVATVSVFVTACMAIQIVIVLALGPDTKGRSLEEINE